MAENANTENGTGANQSQWLFWTCFIALVATSFGFIIRNQVIGEWQAAFNLSETQKGELFGVGLWPFAISIVLFSLVIDKIGYGKALWVAFACHVSSVFVTIFANGYWMLYIGTFILALGNGIVEAVINPAVATVYSKEKTKWLNILHAGWPGGMVLGGLLILLLIPDMHWKWKVALLLIPAAVYGYMLLRAHFPVQERVQAGVSYKAMLQEAGVVGAAIAVLVIFAEIGRVFAWSSAVWIGISVVLILGYGFYVRSLGRPLFIFLVLIMIPLAITELGTDSWITDLMKSIMGETSKSAGYIIVYTAFIMMVLRFLAGPIVERLKPLGLLAASSAIAIIGLVFLSKAAGLAIFFAATFYGIGKTFFWPTMLGIVAERFPKGGALTLNTISGVGILCVGIVGVSWLGNIQDKHIDGALSEANPALHEQVTAPKKLSVFGRYQPLDQDKVDALSAENRSVIAEITKSSKQNALMTVAIFPTIMLACYLILIFYFRSKGGYKPVELEAQTE